MRFNGLSKSKLFFHNNLEVFEVLRVREDGELVTTSSITCPRVFARRELAEREVNRLVESLQGGEFIVREVSHDDLAQRVARKTTGGFSMSPELVLR